MITTTHSKPKPFSTWRKPRPEPKEITKANDEIVDAEWARWIESTQHRMKTSLAEAKETQGGVIELARAMRARRWLHESWFVDWMNQTIGEASRLLNWFTEGVWSYYDVRVKLMRKAAALQRLDRMTRSKLWRIAKGGVPVDFDELDFDLAILRLRAEQEDVKPSTDFDASCGEGSETAHWFFRLSAGLGKRGREARTAVLGNLSDDEVHSSSVDELAELIVQREMDYIDNVRRQERREQKRRLRGSRGLRRNAPLRFRMDI